MADIVSRIYSNFRGVDFRGEEINLTRSPDSLNVWKDYKETESIRTRPGMKLLESFDKSINSIFFYKDNLYVHSGTSIYKIVNGEKVFVVDIPNSNRRGIIHFIYDDLLYVLSQLYFTYDGYNCEQVEGYIPTTTIARKPGGGGTKYEDVNFLTGWRKNSFLADGESKDYYLDSMSIDNVAPIVRVNEKEISADQYSVDYTEGKITFKTAPAKPLTDGQDNVVIEFRKEISGYRSNITSCRLVQMFDNRIFVSGNPSHPNTVWHSSLHDPTYFSDTDYYQEGMDNANVNGIVAGNNALWVFREPSSANTTVFYHTPTIDEEYGKIYPSAHSSIATGCVGKAINFNDDIVFFSERGMEGISGDITTEQAVAHRSSLVDRKLIAEPEYKNMILQEWEGYLLVFIGNKVYLADSRTAFAYENHIEYDWYYWELEKNVTSTCVHDGVLYLGTDDGGVYTLTDMTANVESYWVTPKDKFKYPHKLKTTNKRGCVAEATGDISVYAKLEDTDFELIGEYKNVTDYFVSRIKRKKFKDIQLKFHSKTRFSLETVTLEAFIGGYIKR